MVLSAVRTHASTRPPAGSVLSHTARARAVFLCLQLLVAEFKIGLLKSVFGKLHSATSAAVMRQTRHVSVLGGANRINPGLIAPVRAAEARQEANQQVNKTLVVAHARMEDKVSNGVRCVFNFKCWNEFPPTFRCNLKFTLSLHFFVPNGKKIRKPVPAGDTAARASLLVLSFSVSTRGSLKLLKRFLSQVINRKPYLLQQHVSSQWPSSQALCLWHRAAEKQRETMPRDERMNSLTQHHNSPFGVDSQRKRRADPRIICAYAMSQNRKYIRI